MTQADTGKRMKIAIVYDMVYPFNVGGIELRNHEFAKHLAQNGHEVHIFCTKLWEGKKVISVDGIMLHGVCKYKDYNGERNAYQLILFALSLFKPLMQEKFDVIYTSPFPYFHSFVCKFVSLMTSAPLVFEWNIFLGRSGISHIGIIRGSVNMIFEYLIANMSKRHIAVSHKVEDAVKKSFMFGKRDVSVIYNGFDPKNMPDQRAHYEKNSDIIFVGRLVEQKNATLLIKAVFIAKNKFPKIKVKIIGDGPKRKEVQALIDKSGLNDNFILAGEIKDQKKVYVEMKKSKILVLPSFWEGFGIVVVEANACGLPVITTDFPMNAATELIGHNGIVSGKEPESLASSIISLLGNDDLHAEMSKNAVEFSKAFTWEVKARELEKYLQNLISYR